MDQVEEIKQKTDIVDLIGSYIKLKKAGANYKAACPFHNEKDPSFMVNPNRQIYKCFGCDRGGDVYDFVQEIEGVDFPGALKILADRAGVRLEKIDKKHYDQTKEYYEINELAAKFYQYVLKKEDLGKKGLKYLKNERLLEEKVIEQFRIGYAPKAWDNLVKFLTKKGFDEEKIVKAGLAIKSDKNNSVYDRFRGRIMVPILNPADGVVGFTSRILPQFDDGKMGKYINSPETPIFNKSRTLFGKNFANKKIRESKRAILVEGQFDVISSHQNGFTNTIATSGTSLTPEQVELIGRVAEEIVFAFDSDSAGQRATNKGIDLALVSNLEVKVAIIPGKFGDVDDVLRADPDLWKGALAEAKEVIRYYFDKLIPQDTSSLSANDKRKIVKELMEQVKKAEDPIIEGDWINQISEALEIDEEFVNKAMTKYDQAQPSYSNRTDEDSSSESTKSNSRDSQRRIIGLMMTFEDLSDSIEEEFDLDLITDSKLKDLFQAYRENKLSRGQEKLVDSLVLEVESEYEDEDEETARDEFRQLINRLKSKQKDKIKEKFAQKIKAAEKEGDIKKVKDLIAKFQKIIK